MDTGRGKVDKICQLSGGGVGRGVVRLYDFGSVPDMDNFVHFGRGGWANITIELC